MCKVYKLWKLYVKIFLCLGCCQSSDVEIMWKNSQVFGLVLKRMLLKLPVCEHYSVYGEANPILLECMWNSKVYDLVKPILLACMWKFPGLWCSQAYVVKIVCEISWFMM